MVGDTILLGVAIFFKCKLFVSGTYFSPSLRLGIWTCTFNSRPFKLNWPRIQLPSVWVGVDDGSFWFFLSADLGRLHVKYNIISYHWLWLKTFWREPHQKRQRSHTHTQTALKDYFFRTPYMCFPHTYHQFLLPTKKNTIYANWYICFKPRTKKQVKTQHTPAKRRNVWRFTTVRTESFGECGARPWGSPMCGEGCQVVGPFVART